VGCDRLPEAFQGGDDAASRTNAPAYSPFPTTVAGSIGNLWSVPHSQLYAEPERLEAAGYLTSEGEQSGRRRKHYLPLGRPRRALGGVVRAEPRESFEWRSNLKNIDGEDGGI
jgi:hypothetical protein